MTKAKRVLSSEEHKKVNEERARHFTLEITDVGHDVYSLKSPILISKDRLEILKKICDITGEDLKHYVEHALYQQVALDLTNPSEIGQQVCETLIRKWDPEK